MNDKSNRADVATKRYAGFISYSQKDKEWAQRIHKALENYRLPVGLLGAEKRNQKIGRFFRDDDELSGAPSLGTALQDALDDSNTLIVICSPHAARSKWVDAEIRRFKQRGNAAKVFAIIVGGRPDPEDPEEQCFPQSLLFKVAPDGTLTDEPDEPLAPDVSKDSFPRLITRIVAGIIDVQFDTLWQREKRRSRRRTTIATVATIVGAFIVVSGLVTIHLSNQARLVEESLNLSQQAQSAMDEGRLDDAFRNIYAALPSDLEEADRPITQEAIAALRRLMTNNPAEGVVLQGDRPVKSLRLVNETTLAVQLEDDSIQLVHPENGALIRVIPSAEGMTLLDEKALAGVTSVDDTRTPEGTWTLTNQASVTDLLSDLTIGAVKVVTPDWRLQGGFTTNGSYAIAKSTTVRMAGPALGLFKLTSTPQTDHNDPAYVGAIPFVPTDAYLRITASSATALVFSWGTKEQGLGFWSFTEDEPRLLYAHNSISPCLAATSDISDRHDVIALSADGAVISLAKPVGEQDWCVLLWDADSGEELGYKLVADVGSSGMVALTRDILSVADFGRFTRKNMFHDDGRSWRVRNCDQNLLSVLEIKTGNPAWYYSIEDSLSICGSEQSIYVNKGVTMRQDAPLSGHQATVTAVTYAPESRQLWSGDANGTVRRWQVGKPQNIANDLQALIVTADKGLFAGLFRTASGTDEIRVFNSDGSLYNEPIPYTVIPVDKNDNFNRELSIHILADGNALAVHEYAYCGLSGCPEGVTGKLTVFDLTVSKEIAQYELLSPYETAVKFASDGATLVVRLLEGPLLQIDTITGEVRDRQELAALGIVEDFAHAHDTWWLLTADNPNDPYERRVSLYQIFDSEEPRLLRSVQAQFGALKPAQEGQSLLVTYSTIHQTPMAEIAHLYHDAKGTFTVLNLPEENSSIEDIFFTRSVAKSDRPALALFFGEFGGAPLLIDPDTGEGQQILPAQSISSSIYDRVDDPLNRMLISTDGFKLSILPFAPDQVICPNLNGLSVQEAAVSPDGSKLATADTDIGLSVYDFETCTATYNAPVESLDAIHFVDSDHIWLRDIDNNLQVISLELDLSDALSRARKIAMTLRDGEID